MTYSLGFRVPLDVDLAMGWDWLSSPTAVGFRLQWRDRAGFSPASRSMTASTLATIAAASMEKAAAASRGRRRSFGPSPSGLCLRQVRGPVQLPLLSFRRAEATAGAGRRQILGSGFEVRLDFLLVAPKKPGHRWPGFRTLRSWATSRVRESTELASEPLRLDGQSDTLPGPSGCAGSAPKPIRPRVPDSSKSLRSQSSSDMQGCPLTYPYGVTPYSADGNGKMGA
jgi:hypothetical protein